MVQQRRLAAWIFCATGTLLLASSNGFRVMTPIATRQNKIVGQPHKSALATKVRPDCEQDVRGSISDWNTMVRTSLFTVGLLAATWMPLPANVASNSIMGAQVANAQTDSLSIVTCLFDKCKVPLAKCIANPKCLANVICINTCNNKEDEIGCQIKCGDTFENDVVGQFNNCAVSQMSCVPQKQDEGLYPIPPAENLVPKFDTKFFQGRLYITAGQNPLFDIFPCQVHFFTQPEPGKFFGQLNWRVEEADGEFFTRDAIQRFIQDPQQPAHLINHDNEYLHYKDDWYIIDFEYDNNPEGVPPFALVYYRGSNDAWDGYGGAVLYTRDASFPEALRERLRTAAKKVNMDFDKDFALTDNSCPLEMTSKERLLAREKFLGDAVLQTERQLQVEATRARGNAVNLIQQEEAEAGRALREFSKLTTDFEKEIVKDATLIEKELVKDVVLIEKEIVKDATQIEKEIVKDATKVEKEIVKDASKIEKEVEGLFKSKKP